MLGLWLGFGTGGWGLSWLRGWCWLLGWHRHFDGWWGLAQLGPKLTSQHLGWLSLAPCCWRARHLGPGGDCMWGR